VRKRESAKVNMYKMRKFDAKDFAFYTSSFWVNLSHFRIILNSKKVHCVPKKWRQNSNHYNYGISYQN